MNLVRRNTRLSNLAENARVFAKSATAKIAAGAATVFASATAAAQSAATLGTAASTELDGAETIILGLLVTLVGIVFLFVVYSLIKKSK